MEKEEIMKLLDRRVSDLTVLQLREILDTMEDSNIAVMRVKPDELDLANRIGDLTVRQLMTAMIDFLPRGTPLP